MKMTYNLVAEFNKPVTQRIPTLVNGDALELILTVKEDDKVTLDVVANAKVAFRNIETEEILVFDVNFEDMQVTWEVNPIDLPVGEYEVKIFLFNADGQERVSTYPIDVRVID